MKHSALFLILSFLSLNGYSQKSASEKPKLVIGIVVDQMRNDYIDRFWHRYGEEGFKRLVTNGYRFNNNHYHYVPTKTGPGHASIFTGTSPMNHGIIANNWFDKEKGDMVYCAGDPEMTPLGTSDNAGQRSPNRMQVTTIADENRLATQMRGKTIGIALKDRGAILPAGHTANAAYWFHGKEEGKWISSNYYMETLPQWVQEFNSSGKAKSYFKIWDTLFPLESYVESGTDLNDFEVGFKGKKTATFPYDLRQLKDQNGHYDLIKSTPYGNDLTTDFAMAAIQGEHLGQDSTTDFLTLSYSSPDYIGHNFGVNSKEIQDNYLRLDRNIAELLKFLDQKVGKNKYVVFLTADHGALEVPAYLKSVKVNADYFDAKEFSTKIQDFIQKKYGNKDVIQNMSNDQIYLNHKLLEKLALDVDKVQEELAKFIRGQKNIQRVYTRHQIINNAYTMGMDGWVKNGFHHKRSGDLIYILDPAVVSSWRQGSVHGSGNSYDTHVPLLFFGKGIEHGKTSRRSEIGDIAPTVAVLLGISFPNGATGEPLSEMLEK